MGAGNYRRTKRPTGQMPENPALEIYQQAGPATSQHTSRVTSCHPSGKRAVKLSPAWMPRPFTRSRGCGSWSLGSGSVIWLTFSYARGLSIRILLSRRYAVIPPQCLSVWKTHQCGSYFCTASSASLSMWYSPRSSRAKNWLSISACPGNAWPPDKPGARRK